MLHIICNICYVNDVDLFQIRFVKVQIEDVSPS